MLSVCKLTVYIKLIMFCIMFMYKPIKYCVFICDMVTTDMPGINLANAEGIPRTKRDQCSLCKKKMND